MRSSSNSFNDLLPEEKRALLVQLLRKKARQPKVVPLSFAQQRLWFLDQLDPGNTAYNMPIAVQIGGTLDVKVLELSLREVVQRHESLRTRFEEREGQVVQIIEEVGEWCVPLVDLRGLAQEEREREAQALARQEGQRPCDLVQGPLLRSYLIHLESQEHVLLLTMHHIISDGWSIQVLVHELTTLFHAFTAGQPSPLPPLPIQYADYVVWQRQWLQGEILEAQLAYWVRQLGGSTPLRLSTDHPRPKAMSYRGADYPFELPPDLSGAIGTLSRQEGVTLFMTLLAAFQVLLYRYTGQTDIVVGTDIANRTHVETEALIGLFVNLLVLRSDLNGTLSFREVLSHTKEMVSGAYAHQDAPFEMLVERLFPAQALDCMPLVQVLFVLQNFPWADGGLPGLKLSPFIGAKPETAKFDLALFMYGGSQGLSGMVNYSSDLFEMRSIATMMERFEVLLRNIVSYPEAPIDVLDFYTDAEKTRRAEQKSESFRKLKVAKGGEIHLAGM